MYRCPLHYADYTVMKVTFTACKLPTFNVIEENPCELSNWGTFTVLSFIIINHIPSNM